METTFDNAKPLLGRIIVAACSASKKRMLAAGLEALGARVIAIPVIELCPLEDTGPMDRAIDLLPNYDWILFTSVHGVRFFIQYLQKRAPTTTHLPKVCAIGPATEQAVREFGFEVTMVPDSFIAEGILAALIGYYGTCSSLSGRRILIPRAKEGREVLPEALSSEGAFVDVLPCYQNVRPDLDLQMILDLKTAEPDMFVFTSSSTVRNMIDILGYEDGKRMLLKSIVAVLGPITGSSVEAFGKRPEIVPRESTIASLLQEICTYCSRNYHQ